MSFAALIVPFWANETSPMMLTVAGPENFSVALLANVTSFQLYVPAGYVTVPLILTSVPLAGVAGIVGHVMSLASRIGVEVMSRLLVAVGPRTTVLTYS